jgi:uncharacterized RDD family membrane protein YckC
MTVYPPPPPGSYPPPPPPGAYYPPPRWVLPTEAYTPWVKRMLASVIDWLPIWLVFLVPMIGLVVTDGWECFNAMYGSSNDYCFTSTADFWLIFQAVGFLLTVPYFFWNFCYRQGKTGQSIGKSVMKFKVISEKTWQPIGFWLSLVRQIAHYIDQLICYVGYLFPLWDDKRQTIADKLMTTVCVPLDRTQVPPHISVR